MRCVGAPLMSRRTKHHLNLGISPSFLGILQHASIRYKSLYGYNDSNLLGQTVRLSQIDSKRNKRDWCQSTIVCRVNCHVEK